MSDLEGNREQMDVVASGGLGSSGACVCVCARARVWIAKMQHPQLLCSPPPLFCLLTPFLPHSLITPPCAYSYLLCLSSYISH